MEGKRIYSLWRLLPDDMLADVLRRAAPRDLAVSRCVCRAWRALVDDRRLLRADLLPLSLAGLFIDYSGLPYTNFLARPSSANTTTPYQLPCTSVVDHCNGLVLTYHGVLNPATGGWTPFPGPPPPPRVPGTDRFLYDMYLAFDPTTESSHYEVFVIPIIPPWFGRRRPSAKLNEDEDDAEEYPGSAEWPPSPYRLSVFSSRTGQWDERKFVRENEAAGTAADVEEEPLKAKRKAVCWRGALYVHCQMDIIMRISLSDNKYRVIKPPRDLNMSEYRALHLGKSEKGVYSASLEGREHRLRVWLLHESPQDSKTKWILKHDTGRGLTVPSLNLDQPAYHGPWIFDGGCCDNHGGSNDEAQQNQIVGWNSDDDEALPFQTPQVDDRNTDTNHRYVSIEILGFHPFREIVFLHRSWSRGLAYHLNSSRLEDLGNVCPKDDTLFYEELGYIECAFPYTPCLMAEFSQQYLEFSDDED
ncbi:hypothetical protein PR202_gb28885 [Eleusine coracana subsp. coracana]|uniref:F-box domain-containing protein n=1 Tax=Eleusine coracana subsp. coracana TaxID=191504 RepID=A0AAV5FVK7_ELECO|nr:hypothetical protein PR202_gb28885 [Eleusine coracana subsp. coracana]